MLPVPCSRSDTTATLPRHRLYMMASSPWLAQMWQTMSCKSATWHLRQGYVCVCKSGWRQPGCQSPLLEQTGQMEARLQPPVCQLRRPILKPLPATCKTSWTVSEMPCAADPVLPGRCCMCACPRNTSAASALFDRLVDAFCRYAVTRPSHVQIGEQRACRPCVHSVQLRG